MGVPIEPVPGAVNVPGTVDELVTDLGWQTRCDQVRAALHRTTLPAIDGHVRDELAAKWLEGAR